MPSRLLNKPHEAQVNTVARFSDDLKTADEIVAMLADHHQAT
jgi:hypothetical protein